MDHRQFMQLQEIKNSEKIYDISELFVGGWDRMKRESLCEEG